MKNNIYMIRALSLLLSFCMCLGSFSVPVVSYAAENESPSQMIKNEVLEAVADSGLSSWDGSVKEIVPDGNVYLVKEAAQLAWVAEEVNSGNNFSGKTIKLDTNISLMNISWLPIGDSSNGFSGTFDGNYTCGE